MGPTSLITRVTSRAKGGGKSTEDFLRKKAQAYRSGMQKTLLEARHRLPPSGYESFFIALTRLTATEERRFSSVPVAFDFMATMETPRAIPLQAELAWLSHRIAHYSVAIERFISDQKAIEKVLLSGNFKDALRMLMEHEEKLGVSLWSMSAQIALRQWAEGVADQKDYVNKLRRLFRGGILPFIASFFSQRAEENVSISWYIENSARRISRGRTNDIMKYVSFKALSNWPDSVSQFATILRIEQNHHEIDIYETTLSALQNIITRHPEALPISTLKTIVGRIAHLSDCRIKKLAFALDMTAPQQQLGNSDAGLGLLVQGHVVESYREARRAQRANGSVLGSAVAALVLSERDSRATISNEIRLRNTFRWIDDGLAGVFSKRSDEDGGPLSTEQGVEKFASVFESFEYPRLIRFLIESQLGRGHKDFCASLRLCAFNAKDFTVLDVIGSSRDESSAQQLLAQLSPSPSKTFAELFVSPDLGTDYVLNRDAFSLAQACGLLARGKVDAVGPKIEAALESRSQSILSNAAVFALDAFAATGNLADASALISREVAVSQADPSFLPIRPIFTNCEWRDLKAVANTADLSIALFLYAQAGGDGKTHTYRCFALQTFLDANECTRPSELRSKVSKFDPDKLQFFLWKVCESSVLDMLPALESSRAVLEERRDICALLLYLEPGTPAYEQEILSISSELTIRKGLQTLDGSRVHVDVAALSSVVGREIAESYQRYGALVRSGVVVSESLDAVIRELLKKDVNPKYLLAVPDSEADELLVSMFLQARKRYLFDPYHGLDSYLSKRIRHGSIVGYIRAPAEKEGIVTQQNPDGTYRENAETRVRVHFFQSPVRPALCEVAQS
jgi:hypothetical protein